MESELKPLWIEFPDIPWGSAGWRMGWGEKYANEWHQWFKALSDREREQYIVQWPEPPEWSGFFEYFLRGTPPPWKLKEDAEIALAAIPPAEAEEAIYGTARIKWMLRSYLRRPTITVRSMGRQTPILIDPNGDTWTLVEMKEISPGKYSEPYLSRFNDQLIGADNLELKRPIP